jgi:ArsR family transcriptional regulator
VGPPVLTFFDIARVISMCQYRRMPIPRGPSFCCPPVLQARLGKGDAEELAALLRAIADPARLRLLSFIAAQPTGEACVCHLTKPLGLSQPTVSHHLKLLFDAGLLARERRASWVFYRIVPDRLMALRAALALPTAVEASHGKRTATARH